MLRRTISRKFTCTLHGFRAFCSNIFYDPRLCSPHTTPSWSPAFQYPWGRWSPFAIVCLRKCLTTRQLV